MTDLVIACADIGSVSAGNFGWAAKRIGNRPESAHGRSMEELVQVVVRELRQGAQVALGFECPLFLPVRADPRRLTSQRNGENGRPWSAGAGCGSLATGLVQVAWLLDRFVEEGVRVRPTLDCLEFSAQRSQLLLWEAFVSGNAKAKEGTSLHVADAELAIRAFEAALPDVQTANAITEDVVYSLVGAGLLRSGLRTDPGVLTEPCLVIRA